MISNFPHLAELQARIKKCNQHVFREFESKMPECKTELKTYHSSPSTQNWNQIMFKCNSMNEIEDFTSTGFDQKFQRLMSFSEEENNYPLPDSSGENSLKVSFVLLVVAAVLLL